MAETITLSSGPITDEPVRDDIGRLVKVNMNEDLTGATALSFDVEKPSGTRATWTPTISDRFLQYTTIAGDLNEFGTYRLSPKRTISAEILRGHTRTFFVKDRYE